MDIERRIDNLEKLVHAFINQSNNKAFYDNADKDGIKQRANVIYEEVKAIDGKAWNPKKVYMDGDTVLYGGSFARCLHTNRGIEPTNKVYWELLTVSDMILELMERVSALEQEE